MEYSPLIYYGDSDYETEWEASNTESTPSENATTGARTVSETATSLTDTYDLSVDKMADESQSLSTPVLSDTA